MRYVLTFLMVLSWMAGCAPANREALVKEVLTADPEFAAVLEKHEQLQSRVRTHEQELALTRNTIEQKILQLRKDLAGATNSARVKTADVRKKIQPDQERLQLALSMASEELRAKRVQRASLGRSIVQLKKAVKAASAAWTPEERERQAAQIKDMRQDADRLDREMATLKEHTRLLKIKLLLIKL